MSRERQARFELLFETYHAQIAAYVGRRAPREAVEDVVEETFLVAWRALERVPDEPLPWLYGVARRVLA
ncbi:MAG: RNA polymerase sigma factor, partial [Solirubrobacteraceae bacterium]